MTLLALTPACADGSEPAAEVASRSATTESTDAAQSPEGPSRTSKPAATGARIVASDSEFGRMLFDATGQAIYLFDVERTSVPRCYGECAEAWPPVLTDGKPIAGRGVRGSLLGTTQRADGSAQVTYNRHPLYFYAHEGKHEVLCHDVFLNGGTWYVVRPTGEPAPPG